MVYCIFWLTAVPQSPGVAKLHHSRLLKSTTAS